MSTGFTTEWEDWWLYQHLFDVAGALHDMGKTVLANGRSSALNEEVQDYFLHNFISLFGSADVTLEEVVVYWLKRQVEQGKRSEGQAEQVIAALELLTTEPQGQAHRDSDVPIHGYIS